MNCKETLLLIDGYVDRELDLVRSMEVEGHLEDCGSCLHALESRRELRGVIKSASLRFEAPRDLEKRILAAARNESKYNTDRPRQPWRLSFNPAVLAFASTIALVAVIGWNLLRVNTRSGTQALLTEEVVSSHVRSLQANHLFDVASTDQHTVKPWFSGKLDYSPPVVDLADRGFPLTGGRLDYLAGRPVGALVYRRQQHVINLFIWPAATASAERPGEQQTQSLRGYHTVHWFQAGMTFYAVSDVSIADLQEFARRIVERAGK